jgi:hypothetical protein
MPQSRLSIVNIAKIQEIKNLTLGHLKGRGHEIEFKYLDKKKSEPLALVFNVPLMICDHYHFPRCLGENIWDK